MVNSILDSTKEILGLKSDYTPFDLAVITHINSAFSILTQLGVGPTSGYSIEDSSAEWNDLELPQNQLNMVRTYIFLKVRILFDVPATSFVIEALERQITEHEWRLAEAAEEVIPLPVVMPVRPVPDLPEEVVQW
jgi:hypothetical protein